MRIVSIGSGLAGLIAISSASLGQELATPLFSLDATPSEIAQWIEMSSQFNDRLLATVYWALGGVTGLGLLLFGFNWFAGQRSYDRDRAALEAVLKAHLDTSSASLREELLNAHATLRADLENSYNSLKQNEATYRREFQSEQLAKMSAENERLLDTFSARHDALKEKMEDLIKSKINIIEKNEVRIASELSELNYKSLLNEARIWAGQSPVPINAATTYAQAIGVALENKIIWINIGWILEAIEKEIEKSPPLSAASLASLSKVFINLPQEFSEVGERIIRKASNGELG